MIKSKVAMFHPIRMMRVDIHIGDAPRPIAAQGLDRQHRIIEIAKPVGAVRHPVMCAGRRGIDHAAWRQQLASQQRCACRGGGAAIHFRENGVRGRAQTMPLPHILCDGLRHLCLLQGGKIGGRVIALQCCRFCARADHKLGRRQPAQRAG